MTFISVCISFSLDLALVFVFNVAFIVLCIWLLTA